MQNDKQRIQFGVSGGNPVVPMITSTDRSLDGFQSLISPLLNGFFNVSGCVQQGRRWSFASGCAARARRLSLWGGNHWNEYSSGLPHYYLPSVLESEGEHTYNGKQYYVRCRWNGCRPWNKPAYDCGDGMYKHGENGCDEGVGWFAYAQVRMGPHGSKQYSTMRPRVRDAL
jgi:hypothetical protein